MNLAPDVRVVPSIVHELVRALSSGVGPVGIRGGQYISSREDALNDFHGCGRQRAKILQQCQDDLLGLRVQCLQLGGQLAVNVHIRFSAIILLVCQEHRKTSKMHHDIGRLP